MVNQNKIFSFKIKRQAKKVFPSDVERTVIQLLNPNHVIDFSLSTNASPLYEYCENEDIILAVQRYIKDTHRFS